MKQIEILHDKLKWLGLMSIDTLKPISYVGFKNRASIHRYGTVRRIVFVGQPKDNLFGFYTAPNDDTATMKQAYKMFVKLVKGDMTDYNAGTLQWGDKGIPLDYLDLEQK
jgi:hypothetical protein